MGRSDSRHNLLGAIGCARGRFAISFIESDSRSSVYMIPRTGIAIFDDISAVGRIVWSVEYPRRMPRVAGWGIKHFVATEEMLAWILIPELGPYQLWVAGPNGENPRQLPPIAPDPGFGVPADYIHADGPNLVMSVSSILFHWRLGDTTYRRISPPTMISVRPWIHENYVVWVGTTPRPTTQETRRSATTTSICTTFGPARPG